MTIYNEISHAIKAIKVLDDGSVGATVIFPREFTGFQGHFENRPILPGICQLELVKEIVERAYKYKLHLLKVKNIKFTNVIVPDEQVKVDIAVNNISDVIIIDAELNGSGGKVARLKLELSRPDL